MRDFSTTRPYNPPNPLFDTSDPKPTNNLTRLADEVTTLGGTLVAPADLSSCAAVVNGPDTALAVELCNCQHSVL